MKKSATRIAALILVPCLFADPNLAAAIQSPIAETLSAHFQNFSPSFNKEALAAVPLDGTWLRILHHVPNPAHLLGVARHQGGGRIRGEVVSLNIAERGGRLVESPSIEHQTAVDRLILDGISRYYAEHPDASRRKTTYSLVDTTGQPNAARAYKRPRLFSSQVVFDKAEIETLARYYADRSSPESEAARWLIDFRLSHELSHSHWFVGNPLVLLGGIIVAITSTWINFHHAKADYDLVIRLAMILCGGIWIFAIGAIRMMRDEKEEAHLVLRDAVRQHELFKENKIAYWNVRQLLEREPSLSNLHDYFITFEQIDHPSTWEQGRKSWDKFFAGTDGARWWPGVRTMPMPSDLNNEISSLIKDLASYDSDKKRKAIRRLGEIGPAANQAIPRLVALYGEVSASKSDIDKTLQALGPATSNQLPELQRLLNGYDNEVVARSATVLGEMGQAARPAIPDLVRHAGSVNTGVKNASKTAWQSISPASAEQINELTKLLGGYDSEIQTAAAEVLGLMGSTARSAIPDLVRQAGSVNNPLKKAVASALKQIGPASSGQLNDLIKHLEGFDTEVQTAAASSIGEMRSEATAALPKLERVVKNSVNSTLISTAKEAISKINQGGSPSVPDLGRTGIGSPTPPRAQQPPSYQEQPRRNPTSSSSDVQALIRDLNSFDSAKVSNAVARLTSLGSSAGASIPALIQAAKRAFSNGRDNIEAAIKAVGPAPASELPAIIRSLQSFNSDEFRMAVLVVGDMGSSAQSALPILIEAARNHHGKEIELLDTAVSRIGAPSATEMPKIIRLLSSVSDDVLVRAVRALGSMGPAAKFTIPEITRLLRHDRLKTDVENALVRIGPASPDQVDDLIKILKSPYTEVRIQAAKSLGTLGGNAKRAIPELERIAKYSANSDLEKAALEALWMIDPSRKSGQDDRTSSTSQRSTSSTSQRTQSGFTDWFEEFRKQRVVEQARELDSFFANAERRLNLAIEVGQLQGWQSLVTEATKEKVTIKGKYDEAKRALAEGNDFPYHRFLIYVTQTAQIWLDWIDKAMGNGGGEKKAPTMPTDQDVIRGALKELNLDDMPASLDELRTAHQKAIARLMERQGTPDQVQGKLRLSDADRESHPEYKKARTDYQAINDARDLLKKEVLKNGTGTTSAKDKKGPSDPEPGGGSTSPSNKFYLLDGVTLLATMLGIYSVSMGIAKIMLSFHATPAVAIAASMIAPLLAFIYSWKNLIPMFLSSNHRNASLIHSFEASA